MSDQASNLSGKVGLDVTDFKSGLATLNREIRVIESGFRAAAAGLGDWSKSATGLEARIKALTGQIDIQKQKVAALEGEYKRVAAEKGKTSRAAQELQIRLNKENESLNKMQGELGQTEKALSDMEGETKDAAKEADQLGKAEDRAERATGRLRGALDRLKGSLKNVITDFKALGTRVLRSVALGIAAVGAAAVGAVIGLARFITNAAKAADEIFESAEKLGISTTLFQEFSFIADQVGTDVESVGRAFARTTKAIKEADKKGSPTAKMFEELGVGVRDANGQLRDSQDVFFDLIGSLGDIENETQREILAQQLFGKSYQELIPLINLGADGLAKMTDEAHKMGAVMDEETVKGLADLNDRLAALKGGFKGLLGQMAGKLLPTANKVLDAFQAWLASPAVQAGIKNISEKIGKLAEILGRVIDKLLKGDIKGALSEIIPPATVEQIANFAKTFRDFVDNTLIPFAREHAEEIKGALIGIGAALAAAGIVAAIASIASGIGPLIILVGLLGAAWAGNWGGIQEKTRQVIDFLRTNIPTWLASLKAWWEGFSTSLRTTWEMVWSAIQTVIQTVAPIVNALFAAFRSAFEGDWVGFGENLRVAWDKTWALIKDILSKAWDAIKIIAADLVDNIIRFFTETDWLKVGQDIVKGIADGIKAGAQWAIDAIKALAKAIMDALTGFFKSGSPSKLLLDFGEKDLGMALAQGFLNSIPQIRAPLSAGLGGLDLQAGLAGAGSSLAFAARPTSNKVVTIGGDTIHVTINDRLAAKMYLDQQRRKKEKYAENLM
ncbi:MAG: hypothetical protein A2W35_05385 [Chloroflexi bacterium RBG_16_57_11]|nr:MAG: hypothetical protein A2W35_05385 [Chloroflexi bacterium RBG_16_57_11]